MYPLNEAYDQHLEAIAAAIQASPNLASYLEEEEDEFYNALKAEFEPQIEQAHQQLIDYSPLEIEAFENKLLDERFEGLFLPRVLGYAALRGEITEHFYYARQNDHFGNILKFIAGNSNFDQLRNRIGQSTQVGFALSSDIFVTSLVDSVASKRVRSFLQAQRLTDARTMEGRRRIYRRYAKQFRGKNYHYTPFPLTVGELTTHTKAMNQFLEYRVSSGLDNAAIAPTLHQVVTNPDFAGRKEILRAAVIYGAYFAPDGDERAGLMESINRERKADPEGTAEEILAYLLELKNNRDIEFGADQELQLSNYISTNLDDKLTAYFTLTDKLHNDGFTSPAVHEAVNEELAKHPGLSSFAANIRQTVYVYFDQLAAGLGTSDKDYANWFKITGEQFPVYLKVFGNEAFKQQLASLAKKYTRDLIKVHTNKRGKDYRDIKKTTVTTWKDYGFMTDKQLKDFFKTPRKKKPVE